MVPMVYINNTLCIPTRFKKNEKQNVLKNMNKNY